VTRGLTFPQLAEGLLLGAVAVCALVMSAPPDTYWHLRAGQEIWQTGHVPLIDHYSYTANGHAWPNHEWLWQALSYALYRCGGFPLLVAGGAAIVTGGVAVMWRLMVGPPAVRGLLLLVGLPLVSLSWSLRPQLITQLLLLVLLWLVIHERYRWLPFLFVLWANAHGAVAMGGFLLAALTGVALVRARRGSPADVSRARTLVIVTILSGLGTLVTPLRARLWTEIVESIHTSREIGIVEWKSALELGAFQITFWVLAAAFFAVVLVQRRRLRDMSWADCVLVTAALATFPLAVGAVRNAALFLLVAIPAASRLLGPGVRLGRAAGASPERPRLNALLFAVVLAGEALVVVAAWREPHPNLNWHPISDGALAALRACPRELYNRYNDGGYLVWLVPEKPVFVDARQDSYPTAFLKEGAAVQHGAPYAPLFRRFGIGCAFLPADDGLVGRLRTDGWQTAYADHRWAVLTAPAGPAP